MVPTVIREGVSLAGRLCRLLRVDRGWAVTYTRDPMFGGEVVTKFKLADRDGAMAVFETLVRGVY